MRTSSRANAWLASDIRYFEERLANRGLIGKAVALDNGLGSWELAVPVGGKRKGGHASFALLPAARKAARILRKQEGFSSVRLDVSDPRGACHCIEWGGRPPNWFPYYRGGEHRAFIIAEGRFYGYSEAAIRCHLGGL